MRIMYMEPRDRSGKRGSDPPSEHSIISLTKEDGNERSVPEGDLVIEGEFRRSVVKVRPA